MREFLDTLRQVFILGNGIAPHDFWQFNSSEGVFLPSPPPRGVNGLRYPTTISLGERIPLHFRYHLPKAGHWIFLEDIGGNPIDSTMLKEGPYQELKFDFRPEAIGEKTYYIVEKDAFFETKTKNPLPIQVLPNVPLRVLMLQRFPSFEMKYLKNFIADTGHALTIRSQLTRGKFKYEYYNDEPAPPLRLGSMDYTDFDILILNTDTYNGLPRSVQDHLIAQVEDTGLGLLILPTDAAIEGLGPSLPIIPDGETNLLFGKNTIAVEKFPVTFVAQGPWATMELDNNVVGSFAAEGLGRLGTVNLRNTYKTVLAGETATYRKLWSTILNKMAKPRRRRTVLHTPTIPPKPHRPVRLEFTTAGAQPQLTINDTVLPLRQHAHDRQSWSVEYYPRKKGWHRARIHGDTLPFYVFGDGDWRALEAKAWRTANMRFFIGSGAKASPKVKWMVLSPWYGFLLLLVFMSALWWLPKR